MPSSTPARGNLVAVVTNGTAVLGLGDIGALAGKPVMEGKAVLFKRFADVDVFDIEINSHDPEEVIKVCQLLEPTFGGINLEDIKAPECFYIEETLKKTMKIPVFHDDQHGTAIISGAALLNALEVVGKDIGKIRVVVNGAGAAGVACAEHYVRLGVKRENIILCDTKGVVYKGRTEGMNPYKERFAARYQAAHSGRGHAGRRCVARTLRQRRDHAGHGALHGGPIPSSSPWRIPIQRSPTRKRGPAATTSSWHRPFRLSQPGEQCARIPLHLPRRTGCARHSHQ